MQELHELLKHTNKQATPPQDPQNTTKQNNEKVKRNEADFHVCHEITEYFF